MIYFALNAGRIKVGYSKNVKQRLAGLSSHYPEPLTLIGVIEGNVPLEHAIHTTFQNYQSKGEWYQDCPELRAKIDTLIAEGPAALGITPKERGPKESPIQYNTPRDRLLIPKMARLVWPDDAIAELAGLAGVSLDVSRSWMDGTTDIPLLVRLAFSAVLTMWLHDTPMSFREQPKLIEQKEEAA